MSFFLRDFKKRHPEILRNKQKGSGLRANKIRSLINYLNGQKVHMRVVAFKTSYWNKFKGLLKNKQYSKEMIYAVLYFYALKDFSKKGKSFQVTVCYESYLDIEKVKIYLRKLGKAHKYNYQVSSSYASQNEMIKVADLVAAAGRKLRNKELERLDNYKIIYPSMEELKFYLNKLRK